MDVPPMIFTGNPLIIKPGMVFFMHMILMDSDNELAMNLGETYLVTENGNERLGNKNWIWLCFKPLNINLELILNAPFMTNYNFSINNSYET